MATVDEAIENMKPTPAAAKPPEKRDYVVFLKGASADDRNPVWIQVGKATATTREEALEHIVESLDTDERDGPFMCIAARYCVPVSPVVEPPPPPRRVWK